MLLAERQKSPGSESKLGGMKVGRSMGTIFRYRYGRDEAGGGHRRAKAENGGRKRINGDGRDFAAA
jgi:hypothetical protein